MFVCKHDKLFVIFLCIFLCSFIVEILLKLLREENGMEIQAIIQPGKLFIFQNICVLFFYMIIMISVHRAVQQPRIRLTLYNPI